MKGFKINCDLKKLMNGRSSIKVSEYYKVIYPKYSIFRIIPDTSIRNYSSENIARAICTMYSLPISRLKFKDLKMTYKLPYKTAFMIDVTKTNVCFYIITPEEYENLILEKCTNTWGRATIKKVDSISAYSIDSLKFELMYHNEDSLSLKIDTRENQPLSSILNVLDILEDDDRVGVYYNFMPTNQLNWRSRHKETLEKIKKNMPIEKNKLSAIYIVKFIIDEVAKIFISTLQEIGNFFGEGKNVTDSALSEISVAGINSYDRLDKASLKKGEESIIDTQIVVLSDSKDLVRKKNNAIAVCESFKAVSEDNWFDYKQIKPKKNIEYTEYKVPGAVKNIMSTKEVASTCLQIAGKELLDKHNNIEKIDVLETSIPEELTKGVMCIGEVKYKNRLQKAYLSTDKEYKNLTLCLIAPTRAGKTTLISNLSKDSIKAKECTIIFDFVGNCKLSEEVSQAIGKETSLFIDCSNEETLQGLGYNEIDSYDFNNVFETYRNAKTKTSQLIALIDGVNDNDKSLSAKMRNILESASLVTFIQNKSVKEVFNIIQLHKERIEMINNIPDNQKENLYEYIETLKSINEINDRTGEVIGTKSSKIEGILDRINKLKQNPYMELMLKKDCSNNINLVEEMQKPQLICIKMPEIMFTTDEERDIFCNYWATKIWLALQVRKWKFPKAEDRIKVNIVVDELYQVESTEKFITTKLSRYAKFSCKHIISCHYLEQLKYIREELRSANCSYMLISGCDKKNFDELKEELSPYELQDLLNLPRHNSLNLIKYGRGYAKFISALPSPLTDK